MELCDSVIYKLRQMSEDTKMINIDKLSQGELYELRGYLKATNEMCNFMKENIDHVVD